MNYLTAVFSGDRLKYMKKPLILIISILLIFVSNEAWSETKKKEKPLLKKPQKAGASTSLMQRRVPFKTGVAKPGPVPYRRSQEERIQTAPDSGSEKKGDIDNKAGLSVGIKGGSSAGLTGAVGDVTYSMPYVLPGAQIRGSLGYLTGASNSNVDYLKIATVNLDTLYTFGQQNNVEKPVSVYVGGGLIYPWKVNRNMGKGAWGAHAYIGSKYQIENNTSIYGELAYSGIKYQADQAALKGVEAMFGYSYSF